MGFDISNGLSLMGSTIATQAGNEALEMQKADLENQKTILADKLATTRETNLETLRQSGALTLAQKTSDMAVAANKAEGQNAADLALAQAPKLAAVQAAIVEKNASDPAYLKSLRLVSDASATVSERAAAAASLQQTQLLKLQTASEQQVEDARDSLAAAEKSGDPLAITAAQRAMAVATYSAKDEVQAAIAAKGVADSARMYVESIDTRIARIAGSTQANTPEGKAQIDQLNGERVQAQQSYQQLQGAAVTAAKNIPDINIGKTPGPTGAAPLSSIIPGSPGSTASITGAPTASAAAIPNASNLSIMGH